AGSGLHLLVDHPARGPDRPLLLRDLVEEGLAGLLLARGGRRRAALGERLHLGAVGLEVHLLLVAEDPVAQPGLHQIELCGRELEDREVVAEDEPDRVERLLLLGLGLGAAGGRRPRRQEACRAGETEACRGQCGSRASSCSLARSLARPRSFRPRSSKSAWRFATSSCTTAPSRAPW